MLVACGKSTEPIDSNNDQSSVTAIDTSQANSTDHEKFAIIYGIVLI
jgi:hypothetical protein